MIILGIDPGSTRIGFGIIEKNKNQLTHIKSGLINLPSMSKNSLLPLLEKEISLIINRFHPAVAGLERIYSVKNKKTIIEVAQARGVITNILIKNKLTLIELAPQEIKLAVTGYGRASKEAVAKMVGIILAEPQINRIDDITDALAVAVAASSQFGIAKNAYLDRG